jgi:hypothetical protein
MMSELELALTQLGRELDYPEAPDLRAAVRRRLAEGRRPLVWRRPLVIALAALAVAVGAVMAVPQARSEVLDWLGIGAVTVRQVEDLPPVELATGELGVGEKVSLAEARRRVNFPVRVPTLEGLEDPAVYYGEPLPTGQVSFVYGSPQKPKLLITQVAAIGAYEKLVHSESTKIEQVSVDGWPGVWIEGEHHVLFYPGAGREEPFRLVGNTLVFERADGVTVRIEADISKEEALRIARSMR